MTYSHLISNLAITAVHLGIAARLGILIQRTRSWQDHSKRLSARFLAGTFFVAASLSLPLSPISKGIIWLASAIVVALYGWSLSRTQRHSRWAWHYTGFAMTMILLWSLTQTQPLVFFGIGLSAAAAALLSLRRGLRGDLDKVF